MKPPPGFGPLMSGRGARWVAASSGRGATGAAVVATSQPRAAEAGGEVLAAGGSAVDAALAAALCLTVVEPTANGLGGDVQALVWEGQTACGLVGGGPMPRSASSEAMQAWAGTRRLDLAGGVPHEGWWSATLPGAPAAWAVLHERFGAVSRDVVLAAAITAAADGFEVTPGVADAWQRTAQRLDDRRRHAGWWSTFSHDGRLPAAGERWRLPAHAATLRTMAEHGLDALLRGPAAAVLLAAAAKAAARGDGPSWTADELAAVQATWVDPMAVPTAGGDVLTLPAPTQGPILADALAILRNPASVPSPSTVPSLAASAATTDPAVDPATVHMLAEALGHAFDAADEWLADGVSAPRRPSAPPATGSRSTALGRWSIDAGGTVLVVAADAAGRACVLLQSNYRGVGSGVVVSELGLSLNDRACGFTLDPGHPNGYRGGARPRHTLVPAMRVRDGRLDVALGCMGGMMQPQGILQVLAHLDAGADPHQAVSAPRWRLLDQRRLLLENALLATPAGRHLATSLSARGHLVGTAGPLAFGGAQVVQRRNHRWHAGSDPRKDGGVVALDAGSR